MNKSVVNNLLINCKKKQADLIFYNGLYSTVFPELCCVAVGLYAFGHNRSRLWSLMSGKSMVQFTDGRVAYPYTIHPKVAI